MNTENTVWVVDDEKSIRWVVDKALSRSGLEVITFECAEDLLLALKNDRPNTIISDIHMPGISGIELLGEIQKSAPNLPVIITTAHSDLESAVSAYQSGAFEYLPKPFDIEELIATTQRALLSDREQKSADQPETEDPHTEIIGEAPAMQEVFRAIGRLAHSNINVLINGDSGTGKELVARALHQHSPRHNAAFIALNMAAIPNDLIESELFGHEKGAFTGASQQRQGRFEQANNGTLFLDEIGDMPAEAQTRLLRVLADGEFYRVGGRTLVKVDVRIIAATHQNLERLVIEHLFREDLFHRLNVIRIHIPDLNERREDIPKLARHFLKMAANELSVESKTLLPETEQFLAKQTWPGNVRQLENCCRWVTVMASGREVHIADLPPELRESAINTIANSNWQQDLRIWFSAQLAAGKTDLLNTAVPEFEKVAIETVLDFTNGKKREASELLGWGRNTLTRKIKELELE
jgi:two-component system nitrogen regulation response regulator GlnG